MALSSTVTKKSVTLLMPKLYEITFTLVLLDEAVPVLTKDFTVQYVLGSAIGAKVVQFVELMQLAITTYKAEQAIFTGPTLDAAVVSVHDALTYQQ